MVQHHKYSISDIENMEPWERHVYVNKLIQHLKEEAEEAKRNS
jgi:hypothetical protein